jgi:hypothetical protein
VFWAMKHLVSSCRASEAKASQKHAQHSHGDKPVTHNEQAGQAAFHLNRCDQNVAWTMLFPWLLLLPGIGGASVVWTVHRHVLTCFHDLAMLASMIHLWATIRGISFPVTSSLEIRAYQASWQPDRRPLRLKRCAHRLAAHW